MEQPDYMPALRFVSRLKALTTSTKRIGPVKIGPSGFSLPPLAKGAAF